MVFQCFSAFRFTLLFLQFFSTPFDCNDMSQIIEFFPNLIVVKLFACAEVRSPEKGPFPQPRRVSFPNLRNLEFILGGITPGYECHLISGFAKASKNLEMISITGTTPNLAIVQELVDSSAHSLLWLRTLPLGRFSS
jgi:hypothetical protein